MADDAVLVRPAGADDLDAIVDTVWQVAAEGRFIGTEVPFDRVARRQRLAGALEADDRLLLVAVAAEQIVGHIGIDVASYGVADVHMLLIDGWRGRGIGQRLLEAAIAWARQAGAHKMALEAWPDNSPALALYERAGFYYEGRKLSYYRRSNGERWDSVLMGLALQPERPMVRPVRDGDGWDLVALIGACWSEYPGCVMDAHGEYPELLSPASAYAAKGGAMWVVDGPGGVVASVARSACVGGVVELEKLYVAKRWRRRGLARHLVDMVETEAKACGATTVELWSDTRFADAHRSYERFGYRATGARRELHDLSATAEVHFQKSPLSNSPVSSDPMEPVQPVS